jgi:hypothetical protein
MLVLLLGGHGTTKELVEKARDMYAMVLRPLLRVHLSQESILQIVKYGSGVAKYQILPACTQAS